MLSEYFSPLYLNVICGGYDDPFPRWSTMNILSAIISHLRKPSQNSDPPFMRKKWFWMSCSACSVASYQNWWFFLCFFVLLTVSPTSEDMMTLSPDDRQWTYWALQFLIWENQARNLILWLFFETLIVLLFHFFTCRCIDILSVLNSSVSLHSLLSPLALLK